MKHTVLIRPDCTRSGVIVTCYINGRKLFRAAPWVESPGDAQAAPPAAASPPAQAGPRKRGV